MTPGWEDPSMRPLPGGYSGETFLAGAEPDLSVVRVYARNPARAAIDASLLRLVRGLVPVPAVLELRHPTAESPGVLVTEYVDGEPLEPLLAAGHPDLPLESIGQAVAGVVNALSGIPFLRFGGFVDPELGVVSWDLGDDLGEWAERQGGTGRLGSWSPRQRERLAGLLEDAQALLDEEGEAAPPRAVLTHSDLNAKNILVDRTTGAVNAVLDWEFAHAGSMHTDVGNFCRFERDPRLVNPFLDAVADARRIDVDRQRTLGRAMDLWALVELAGREEPNPVSDLASQLLLAQATTGDLDAWPFSTPRVAPPGR